jgi:hypothetical protein
MTAATSRKRPQQQELQTDVGAEHSNKKAKGRPRVDKQDDTAADVSRLKTTWVSYLQSVDINGSVVVPKFVSLKEHIDSEKKTP